MRPAEPEQWLPVSSFSKRVETPLTQQLLPPGERVCRVREEGDGAGSRIKRLRGAPGRGKGAPEARAGK